MNRQEGGKLLDTWGEGFVIGFLVAVVALGLIVFGFKLGYEARGKESK